jgi:hypothetical protein
MDISKWEVGSLFAAEEKKVLRLDGTFKPATARSNILIFHLGISCTVF